MQKAVYCEKGSACAAATGGKGTVIRNTAVFTHSMGNLILAAAIHNKHCSLDAATSKWYSLAAPWFGSSSAFLMKEQCEGRF